MLGHYELADHSMETTRWERMTAVLLSVAFLLVPALVALAHTEFDYSTPADGETVEEPVSEITVAFTLPVTIVGAGFEVLGPGGDIVAPTVETEDDAVFKLLLDEPLAGGDVGVRFEVAAEDGHVLAGGFSFTVTASATTTTVPAASTTTTGAETSSTTTTTQAEVITTVVTGTTSVPDEAGSGNGLTPVLVGVGVLLVGGLGLYAGIRFRS